MLGSEPGTNRLQLQRTLATWSPCRQEKIKKLDALFPFQNFKVSNDFPEAE